VDWALGTLLVLSFEEQIRINATPFTGLVDSLLRCSLPFHSFLIRALMPSPSSPPGRRHRMDGMEVEKEAKALVEYEGEEEGNNQQQQEEEAAAENRTAPSQTDRLRALKVWEILRNLSFVPENEASLADHHMLVMTTIRLIVRHCRRVGGAAEQERPGCVRQRLPLPSAVSKDCCLHHARPCLFLGQGTPCIGCDGDGDGDQAAADGRARLGGRSFRTAGGG